ncbi:MAG: hypothetical protein JNL74_16775 [Fibrobacteres bacterium]|nr:hypothetical protein [Fibrobacterota bacterium]
MTTDRSYNCPVCHLTLSLADRDKDGYTVCPVCGAVMAIVISNGHILPVVHAVENKRSQLRFRLHSILTHFSIGTMPIAIIASVIAFITELAFIPVWHNFDRAGIMMVFVSLIAGLITFLTGVIDWKKRYRGRPYLQISIKVKLSLLLVVVCTGALLLHGFSTTSTTISVTYLIYFSLLNGAMAVYTVLGNIGGKLVYGK